MRLASNTPRGRASDNSFIFNRSADWPQLAHPVEHVCVYIYIERERDIIIGFVFVVDHSFDIALGAVKN